MRLLISIAALALIATSAVAQRRGPATGDFLVATREFGDPNFSESVLLVIRHTGDGTIGLLINRPTTLSPAEVFDELGPEADYDGVLYYGGPVLPARVLVLSRHRSYTPGTSESTRATPPGVRASSMPKSPREAGSSCRGARI
jgi:putative AlgH/UPF0301 family transcriptional regulator